MKTYRMEVSVRPSESKWLSSKRSTGLCYRQRLTIRANTEQEARREVLETCWANGYIVDRFHSVTPV